MRKYVSFSFATTKTPLEVSRIFLLSLGTDTNHPWRWLKPFISSKKMEAGGLPKVEVDGPFTRQFRKGEEGIPSQDNIILGIWRLVKVSCNSPIDSLNLKDCSELQLDIQTFRILLIQVRHLTRCCWPSYEVYWTTGRCYPGTP